MYLLAIGLQGACKLLATQLHDLKRTFWTPKDVVKPAFRPCTISWLAMKMYLLAIGLRQSASHKVAGCSGVRGAVLPKLGRSRKQVSVLTNR